MNKVMTSFKKMLKQAFNPRSKLSISNWCEKYIYLPSVSSGTSGKYSLRNYSYLREIYDSVENPSVRKVVIKKSVQSGLTTLGQNVLLWYVCNKNLPLSYFTATTELAKRFSKRTLLPTIEQCEPIQELRPQSIDRETILYWQFKNCILRLAGAGSVNALSSDPSALVILDECSKWEDSKTEARSVELAIARAQTFPLEKKIILISTPAEASTCVISREYKTGDERVFEVPSPNTGIMFEITIDLLRKPLDYQDADGNYSWIKIKKGVFLEDPTTRIYGDDGKTIIKEGSPIYENQKADMVRKGKWRATNLNPTDTECHSYVVTSLYSLDVSWGDLLVKFLQCDGDLDALKDLRNNFLGQAWEQIAASIRLEEIERVVENSPRYSIGFVPEYLGDDGMLLMGCDQQMNHFYFTVVALCSSGKCYLIDYGKVLDLESLEKIATKGYKTLDAKEEYFVSRAVIDEGGFPVNQIRDFSVKTGFTFVSSKGVAASYGSAYRNGEIEHPVGSGIKIPYVTINDDQMKKQLLLGAIKSLNDDLYFPFNLEEDYKKQICSEQLIKNKKEEWVWQKKGPNHYLDCLKMCWALVDFNRRRLPINSVEVEVGEPKDKE